MYLAQEDHSSREMKRALEVNPAVIEPDFSKIVREVSASRQDYITFTSLLSIREDCNILQLDNVDTGKRDNQFYYNNKRTEEEVARFFSGFRGMDSYVRRKDFPNDEAVALDSAMIALLEYANRVRQHIVPY